MVKLDSYLTTMNVHLPTLQRDLVLLARVSRTYALVTLMQIEDSGFCEKGAGGEFVSGDTLQFDSGKLPTNTHGGMLSHAYVLGISHVVEIVRQLRGEATAQVPDAEIGIYGGYTGPGAATLILRRAA